MATTVSTFVTDVGNDFNPAPEESVFASLLQQYEKVIFQSIITSFGLDAFIKDKLGGDVDTIHNARKGDDGGGYKNSMNAEAYKMRGDYSSGEYHSHAKYRKVNRQFSEQRKTGNLHDAYTGKLLTPNEGHDLDHVIAAKKIHDDPGRVLSGLKGVDLANAPENLKPTNRRTNRTKKTDDMATFLSKHGSEYSSENKLIMQRTEEKARFDYERKINTAYYTSYGFWQDTGLAAAKTGVQMGLRQTLGFVMTEIWLAVKESLVLAGHSLKDKLEAVGAGIKLGFKRAQENFKLLLSQFDAGAISGVMSSLTSTLCNIFCTTAQNVGRIIRQTWTSIVEATRILIFNPDLLPFAARMRAALKILATGASVVLGTIVQEVVHTKLAPYVSAIPALSDTLLEIISAFAGGICTGFLSVSLLYFIDSDPFSGFLTSSMDHTIKEYKRQARLFATYAAELAKLDIETFEKETALYRDLAMQLELVKDDYELNELLTHATKKLGIPSPWGEGRSLDDFMKDPTATLRFEA